MEVSLLRHGDCEVDFSKQNKRFQLSNNGVEQARAVAKNLSRMIGNLAVEYDRLITSPYERAVQTAKIICETAEWTVDDRVSERDWGLYGALHQDKRAQAFPEVEQELARDYYGFRLPGGENLKDVQVRQVDLLLQLKESGARRVFISTHGGFMRAFQHLIEDTPFDLTCDEDATDILNPIEHCSLITYRRLGRNLCKRAVNLTEKYTNDVGSEWVVADGLCPDRCMSSTT